MRPLNRRRRWMTLGAVSAGACVLSLAVLSGQDDPLLKGEPLPQVIARTQKEKPTFAKRQQDLLAARYDLAEPSGRRRDDDARARPCRTACASSCRRT